MLNPTHIARKNQKAVIKYDIRYTDRDSPVHANHPKESLYTFFFFNGKIIEDIFH